MTRVAVLSDTHGLLRPEVIQIITGCDAIIHGGDINNQQILDQLSALAPLYVVRGNNDKEWAEHLPENITIQIENCVLFVVAWYDDADSVFPVCAHCSLLFCFLKI